jgi:hypothetical protein
MLIAPCRSYDGPVDTKGAIMAESDTGRVHVGDRVAIAGHRVGDVARSGEVVEVLGEPGHERYLVRWDDGHETFVYAGSEIRVERHAAAKH